MRSVPMVAYLIYVLKIFFRNLQSTSKSSIRQRRVGNQLRFVLLGGPIRSAKPTIKTGEYMSKAFLAQVLRDSAQITGVAANRATSDLIDAIVQELKKSGKFTLPSFGTFVVRKTKARKGLNPRTGEAIKVKAGKTVRFKASPSLKKMV